MRQLLRTFHATVATEITVTETDRKGAWATLMLALETSLPGALCAVPFLRLNEAAHPTHRSVCVRCAVVPRRGPGRLRLATPRRAGRAQVGAVPAAGRRDPGGLGGAPVRAVAHHGPGAVAARERLVRMCTDSQRWPASQRPPCCSTADDVAGAPYPSAPAATPDAHRCRDRRCAARRRGGRRQARPRAHSSQGPPCPRGTCGCARRRRRVRALP